ncbi:hypothetical protein Asulf_01516 [Archaeoglobus sulfaticallidus PM70-1]|uniref:Uncharacterized protein n=1 Tax=Archaeoglobus sulfaticallidus PM70-1 TaxID=387631 RepID=N0BD20_9EURY|nr:hypothetical protein [Archaeoglobus sulfaticallidus]AGK61499.1 hypothetical protein Asulf_01516 [Archaeoglobus sulfaticallidus PM70-1]
MSFPTVNDVREKLGDAYSTDPADPIIQSFLDRRIAQIKELTGRDFTGSVPETIFLWVLNYTCIDVLVNDLTGNDSADALDYEIGELRESKDENVKLKLTVIETLKEAADLSLKQYFMQQRNYYDYVSEVDEEYQRSLIFRRSSP